MYAANSGKEMVKKGSKDVVPVDIYMQNYLAAKSAANGNIRQFVNNLIVRHEKVQRLLKKRYPHLRIVEVAGNCATIIDRDKYTAFDVCVDKKTKRLKCSYDKDDLCDHVRYLLISGEFTEFETLEDYLNGKTDEVIMESNSSIGGSGSSSTRKGDLTTTTTALIA